MVKFAAIIEARMTSKRLRKKFYMRQVEKSFLWHLTKRLKRVKEIKQNNLSYNNK